MTIQGMKGKSGHCQTINTGFLPAAAVIEATITPEEGHRKQWQSNSGRQASQAFTWCTFGYGDYFWNVREKFLKVHLFLSWLIC